MIEVRGDPDLGEEALGAQHHRQLGSEHLERYLPLVLQLRREIDRGHSPRAELTLDAIAVLDRREEELTLTGQDTSGVEPRAPTARRLSDDV